MYVTVCKYVYVWQVSMYTVYVCMCMYVCMASIGGPPKEPKAPTHYFTVPDVGEDGMRDEDR